MSDDSGFTPLKDKISSFSAMTLETKLDLLRKLSKDVTYNDDYTNQLAEENFLGIVLSDITKTNLDISVPQNLSYARLFFMFMHNSLGTESGTQLKIFKNVFENDLDKLKTLLNIVISDLKVQKFFLGVIYKLYFLNTKVLTDFLSQKHFDLFYFVIQNIEFSVDIKVLKEDKDRQEINDWIIIIFEYILKNEEKCKLISNESFFTYIFTHHLDKIIFFEIIRDLVDYAKDSKILLIGLHHIKLFTELFLKNVDEIHSTLSKANLVEDYLKLDSDKELHLRNRRILCLIDVFSVILTTDDLNNEDYRKVIFAQLSNEEFIDKMYDILILTDSLYDTVFKRNKALKANEKHLVPKLPEKNLFFGFQTNILKFLSNFAYKNEIMKSYVIKSPEKFYHFLVYLKVDNCNPFNKEWTVLMIKSLCENCSKIQNFIKDLKPLEMDPLLKDYIINKGTQKVNFGSSKEKEIYFSMLNKKSD